MLGARGKTSIISSFPDKLIRNMTFPTDVISVFIAEGPTPRLATAAGLAWLQENCSGEYDPVEVHEWAKDTMRRCGSAAFVTAAKMIMENSAEAREAMASDGNLLRALSRNGPLFGPDGPRAHEAALDPLFHRNYVLTLIRDTISDHGLRGAAIYGIAELERGEIYTACLKEIRRLKDLSLNPSPAIATLTDVINAAHDGDRARVDFNRQFAPTKWQPDYSDDGIAAILASKTPLHLIPGSFERSIPELDVFVDSVRKKFPWRAAARVSGAGLGGAVTIHVDVGIAHSFLDWFSTLENQGWAIRSVRPGAPTEFMFQ
jgi:hypothetical protein